MILFSLNVSLNVSKFDIRVPVMSAGLESMDLVMSKEVEGQSRGFAFLTFYNHECAAAAKDILTKPSFK